MKRLTREEFLELYKTGEENLWKVFNQIFDRLEELEKIVVVQAKKIKEMEDKLSKNSTNSSIPPSKDRFHKTNNGQNILENLKLALLGRPFIPDPYP